MALSDDIEIVSDRAACFKNLTENEQMEMPRLVKQSIGSRPKHPSRPQRHCASRDSPKHRPKLTVCKNDSNNNEATDTLSSMPLLVKQTSFTFAGHSSRGPLIGDDEKEGNGIDRRRQMTKQDSLTMLRRRSLTCGRDTGELDKKNDSLSSNPRLVKQTSFTVAGHSSQGGLISNDENVGNGSDRRQQMAKKNGRRSLMCKKNDEKNDTLSSNPVKHTSSKGARLLSREPLIGNDENVSTGSNRRLQMAKQNSLRMPRRRSLTYGKMDEKNDSLSSYPQLVKQTSLKGARLSSRGPLIGNDEIASNGPNRRLQMSKQNSLTMPRRPSRTFDSEDNPFETTNFLSSTRRLVEQAQHL